MRFRGEDTVARWKVAVPNVAVFESSPNYNSSERSIIEWHFACENNTCPIVSFVSVRTAKAHLKFARGRNFLRLQNIFSKLMQMDRHRNGLFIAIHNLYLRCNLNWEKMHLLCYYSMIEWCLLVRLGSAI